MTPEAQRIAIAEACGWKPQHSDFWNRTIHVHEATKMEARWPNGLPDFLNDLNAMHEAENVLTDAQQEPMGYWLTVLTSPNTGYGTRETFIYAHATAAQRAEAFLRTLNLWKEDAP